MKLLDARKPGRPKDPDLESRRKREILAASARIFADRGYAEADVQEIADAVGVGKGTVYRYFPTKQELFLATVDRGLSDLSDQIDGLFENVSRDPLEMVRDAVTAYLKFFRSRPQMAELFIQERATFRDRHTPLYFAEKYKKHDRDVPFINALIRLGRFRKMPADRVLDVVCDLLYGTVLSNHLSGRRAEPKKQAAAILDVLFNGLLSDAERKRMARRQVAGTAIAVMMTFAMTGCSGSSSADQAAAAKEEAIAVTVEPVTTRTIQRTVTAVGTLNGFEEATLAPKVEGRIVAIRADVGDRVAPGAMLLALDPKDYDLAVGEAQQAFAAELAKLGLTELPRGMFDVAEVPSVKRAALAIEDAARRLKQKKGLQSTNAASIEEVEILETELKIAEATRNHMATEAQAVLSAARLRKASLELAIQRRADCNLTAPLPSEWLIKSLPKGAEIRYAVAQRYLSEGEMVRSMPVTNAFKLVLDFRLKLRVMVPERHVSEVAVGQNVDVTTDAYANRTFTGIVTRLNPTIDPLNRTFAVEIEIHNENAALKCGGFAKASIRTKSDTHMITVPPSAIVTFAGVNKVFVAEGGKAKAVEVEIGSRDRDWVEVRGKLGAEAKVITSGLSLVVDASAVRIK